MRLILRLLILLISLIVATSIALSIFVNYDSVKNNLQLTLNNKIEGNFEINGDLEISFLPFVKVTANNVILSNINKNFPISSLEVREVILGINLISLLQKKPKINSLTFISPTIKSTFNKIDTNNVDVKELDKAIKNNDAAPEGAQETEGKIEEVAEVGKIKVSLELKEEKAEVIERQEEKAKVTNLKKGKKFETIDVVKNIKNPDLEYDNSTIISSFFNFNLENENIFDLSRINKITIKDGYFQKIGLGKEIILDIKKIDLISVGGFSGHGFNIHGSAFINNIPSQFDLFMDLDDEKILQGIFESPILKIELSGEIMHSKIDHLFDANFVGDLNVNIVNPKEFFTKYLSKYMLIYGKINTVFPIGISASIDSVKNKFDISNILFDSEIIQGGGDMRLEFLENKVDVESDLKIDYIDIDRLWLPRFISYNQDMINYEKNIMESFFRDRNDNNKTNIINYDNSLESIKSEKLLDFDKINAIVNINLEKVKYLKDFMTNIDINLLFDDGVMNLTNLKLNTPDEGVLKVKQNINQDSKNRGVIFDFKFSGGDFNKFLTWINLKSKLFLLKDTVPYDISGDAIFLSRFLGLKDLEIDLDQGKDVAKGNIRFDNSKELENIDIRFDINKLTLNDYFDLSLERNKYLSPGSLLNKLLWLKTIDSNREISLKIKKLEYNDHIFLNQNIDINVGRGFFNIRDLILRPYNTDIDLKLSALIDLQSKPKLELDIGLNNFNYNSFDLEDNRKFRRLPFSDRFFYLPTLIDFDGKINLRSKNSAIDNFILDEVNLSGNLDGGVWSIKNGGLDVFGGKMDYNGDIVLRNIKSVNGSFVLSKINNYKFLNQLFGVRNITGMSNVSGVINSSGVNKKEFIDILDIKSQFVSANVNVKGFGISDLQRSLLSARRSGHKNIDSNSILLNNNTVSNFSEIKGSFDIGSSRAINKLIANASNVGTNSVTSGSIDLSKKSFEGVTNAIFITGTTDNQIPLNIAIGHRGPFSNLQNSANLSQVEQYLDSL